MIVLVGEVLKEGNMSVNERRSKTLAATNVAEWVKILPIFCMLTRLNHSESMAALKAATP